MSLINMLEDIIQTRIQKIQELKKQGIDPFPEKVKRSFEISKALKDFSILSKKKKKIDLAGRIVAIRFHKNIIFVDLKDSTAKIQLIFKEDILSSQKLEFFNKYFDLGDFLGVKGVLIKSQTGEKSLLVYDYQMLAKSLRPIPKEWYGLEDAEERFRKRYLDLLVNDEVKQRFYLRSKIISLIREYFNSLGYLEVETPILQAVYGGANAKPFRSYLDYLSLPVYLRIAPELYLKRLLIGGMDKIYEIGKCFRNEGIDREHNPEFTMLELYSAYENREYLMKLLKGLFKFLEKNLKKEAPVLSKLVKEEWKIISLETFLKSKTGLTLKDSEEDWRQKAQELKIEIQGEESKEKIMDLVFKNFRGEIKKPTFIIDQPVILSPLAKKKSDNPDLTSRFQLIINGWELVNGFSELNDPLDQRERFDRQEQNRKKGDLEAHPRDTDFLLALEYGMPPAAGLGIGIDRLVAILTEAPSLKEVILFPFMKPKNEEEN